MKEPPLSEVFSLLDRTTVVADVIEYWCQQRDCRELADVISMVNEFARHGRRQDFGSSAGNTATAAVEETLFGLWSLNCDHEFRFSHSSFFEDGGRIISMASALLSLFYLSHYDYAAGRPPAEAISSSNLAAFGVLHFNFGTLGGEIYFNTYLVYLQRLIQDSCSVAEGPFDAAVESVSLRLA